MNFISFTNKNMGLTNQLYVLSNGIDQAIKNQCKVVVIDKFLCDFSLDKYMSISNILDLEKMNIYFKQKYNLILVDKYNFNFKLLNVTYGTKDNKIDITQDINEKYNHNGKLFIDKNVNISNIKEVPVYGPKKNIWIKYKINNEIIIDEYTEILNKDIDYTNNNYIQCKMGWPSKTYNTFLDILTHITYNKRYFDISKRLLSDTIITKKVNLIHLRLEDDGVKHWSKMNKMSSTIFKKKLENKYIQLIKKYIDKNNITIVLSSSFNNEVINFLNNNEYKCFISKKKYFKYRELNAIVDFIISNQCNNVFIGNYNLNGNNGSSFSYYIYKTLNSNDIIYKYIDLDHL